MANFSPAYGFCAVLCEELDATAVGLPLSLVDLTQLEQDIPVGSSANLIIQCNGFREIITYNGDGTIVRGQEGTAARAWTDGCKVFFDWTAANMDAWIECRTETENETEPDEKPAKLPGYETVWDSDEGQWCYVEIDPTPEGESPFEWRDCGWIYYVVDGEIKRKPDPNKQADGVIKNATVTIKDGKKFYSKGCPLIYKSSCTGCEKCENTEETE